MRRIVPLGVMCALVIAACGSSSTSGGARGTELSYFPSNSAFVMSVVTDPNSSAVKDAQSLVGQFPIATFGEAALMSQLQRRGINYQSDVRPLFGNPLIFGLAGPAISAGSSNEFLVVWVTKDAGKLHALIKRLPGLQSTGSRDGATLYSSTGPSAFAVDGATVILAASASTLDSALDRHAHGGGLSATDFTRASSGLPQNTFMEGFGNLQQILATPAAANARRVPWVAALRTYAASVTANSSGLSIRYRIDTSGGSLSPSQIPFASGSVAPAFAGTLPITAAVKNPAQIVTFIEGAEQDAGTASYQKFLQNQAAVKARTGVNVNDLLKLLTGDLIVSSDAHTTMVRAAVSDASAAANNLSKLATDPVGFTDTPSKISRLGGGFYSIKEPKLTLTIGVLGDQLVAGRASAADLRSFAGAPTTPAAGAQGAVAFRVALVPLLQAVLKKAPPKIVQSVLASLGDVTGWIASSPRELTGVATLAVK
jgi:hypothetical protein